MKEYVKPELYYEDFQLSNNVAVKCAIKFTNQNHSDGNHCFYEEPSSGDKIFSVEPICNETFTQMYCISNSADSFTLLNS